MRIVNLPYKSFSQDIGEVLSQTFIPIGRNVALKFWNVRVHHHQDWGEGLFMYALPTVPDPEQNCMHAHLIVVKVHDHPVDREVYEDDAESLFRAAVEYAGRIPLKVNAFSLFHIYSGFRETHVHRLKRFGCKAWLKCRRLLPPNDQKLKAMSFPIVSRDPDRAVKIILTLIVNFWRKAVYSLAEKLGVGRWQYNDNVMKLYSLLLYNIIVIKDAVRRITQYYCAIINWLEDKLKTVLRVAAGKEALAKVLHKLSPKANFRGILEVSREAAVKVLVYSVFDRAERRIKGCDYGWDRAERYLEFLGLNAVGELR